MTDFFGKPLDKIDADDILSLIDTPEGQLFEIKSELAEKNGRDLWYKPPESGKQRKGPGDYAKQNIFKEVVAFANSEGGWLVIGLTETDDHPKRVGGLATLLLPDCHELADRLKRAAYDWIDPPLPALQCRGIEIGEKTGEGVIIFRIPRSLDAPHRLNKRNLTQEAYKRVGDESKPMKMREIQDMTLDMARGQERIEREFNNARKRYQLLIPDQNHRKPLLGFNITLVPLSGPVTIDRPYLLTDLFLRKHSIEGGWNNRQRSNFETIDAGFPGGASGVQPILRGAQKTWWGKRSQLSDVFIITVEIFETGTIQLSVKNNFDPLRLSIRWLLADIANALCIAERVRNIGGIPDGEYAMELEINIEAIGEHGKYEPIEEYFLLGSLRDEQYNSSRRDGPTPLLLPRYRIGEKKDFPKIVKLVMDDLCNAIGRPHEDGFEFENICLS